MQDVAPQFPEPYLVDGDEGARLMGVSPRTLFQMEKDGKIKAVRIGRSVRYSPDALRKWVEQQLAGQ